ncbi:dethiobiotin synthase [Thermolongibacillus altinsuensis]|jgi:dethiobiotin synthetase|uniref:ATP-dependent dethiobiotin synthetase BioD n=1 Tax=Thermolongibacillus altinsuensis TaxID=575256 RepID=A0A4V2QAP2_9BACL|nr:dethiobiotin synthase [Thermolongibacillus altinsuensis]TCL53142.1 dethiobiotin synthase [Thermolongibacillus altinsuensis]
MKGFFITGTDTDVGKTIVTTLLLHTLQQNGVSSIAYKPVQSGAEWKDEKWVAPDVEMYRRVAHVNEEECCTYLLKTPCSPHLAAKLDGVTIDPKEIVSHVRLLQETYECVLVEGAGGIAVPLVDDAYMIADLAADLQLPVIIVARTGVGTINHTVLTIEYAKKRGLSLAGIVMNGFSEPPTDVEMDNVRMIEKMTGIPVIGMIPYMNPIRFDEVNGIWKGEWWR